MSRSHAIGTRAALVAALAILPSPALLAAAGDDVTPFTVSLPTVTGPIPATADNFPFGAEGTFFMPPVPPGYVVEEYFMSGSGDIYEYTPTGIRVVSPCPAAATAGCTNVPYTTRLLVKRPIDPAQFSGTVVIEPLNPSANFDIAGVWDRGRQYFVRNGDIFIGWTSKSVVVNALKGWNPTRYAALSWPYLPATPRSNNGAEDGITFDIAAQIGALIKSNGAGSPIHDYNVKHVFEAGFSQDGGFTFTQAEVFHALERMPGGGPIYDGYLPMGTGGPSNIDFGLTPAGALPAGDPRLKMQPREVPVIHILTETEVLGAASRGLTYRRPDSDAPDDRYRLWEVPGGSHVSNDLHDPIIALQVESAEIQKVSPFDQQPVGCAHQQFIPGPTVGIPGVVDPNPFPWAYVQNAGFADITAWIENGTPPPRGDRIEVENGAIVRDEFGNALGGVRTPYLDVPTATYVPFDTVAHQTLFSAFCGLYGYSIPFDHTELHTLYRNHGSYVSRVARESEDLVEERFWLRADADQVVQEAAQADVP